MSLTKRQIERAGRLYGLAMAAHSDAAGAESQIEAAVMARASAIASAALARLGFDRSELLTVGDCIDAVRNNYGKR